MSDTLDHLSERFAPPELVQPDVVQTGDVIEHDHRAHTVVWARRHGNWVSMELTQIVTGTPSHAIFDMQRNTVLRWAANDA